MLATSSTLADAVVTGGGLLLTGASVLIYRGILHLLHRSDAIAKTVSEIHDKVDGHGERVAHIEGVLGLPLGSSER